MGLVKSAAYSVHTTKSKIMKAIIRIITIVLALLYWTSSSLAEDMSEIVSKHVAALGKHANRLPTDDPPRWASPHLCKRQLGLELK